MAMKMADHAEIVEPTTLSWCLFQGIPRDGMRLGAAKATVTPPGAAPPSPLAEVTNMPRALLRISQRLTTEKVRCLKASRPAQEHVLAVLCHSFARAISPNHHDRSIWRRC